MAKPVTYSVGRRALFGVAYVAVLATVVGLLILQSQGAFRDTVEVTTDLRSVGDGLPVGSDVKMRGVIVGRVAKVDSTLEVSTVTIEIKPEFADDVPASVKTRILPTNLFGAPFVDLNVVGPEKPVLEAGSTIPEDRSEESVQMQTVFKKVYDVLVAVEPAKLNLTLSAIADAFRGNGERIGQMIERSEDYLSALNVNAELFQRDLTLLASTLEGVDSATPDLLAAADNVSATARLIVDTRNELRALLTAGVSAADTSDAFLNTNGQRLVRLFAHGARVSEILAPVSADINRSLVGFERVARLLSGAVDPHEGVFVDVTASLNDYQPYTSADCPRYGALTASTCTGGVGRESAANRSASSYGGNVGTVGSPEEKRLLGTILDQSDPDGAGDLASLVLGPLLRSRGTVR